MTITTDLNHLAVELIILTTSNWSTDNKVFVPLPNAVIFLQKEYSDSFMLEEPDYTMTSDDEGKLKIYEEMLMLSVLLSKIIVKAISLMAI